MDYNDFNKTYYRANYEWNVSEYVKTNMDYRNDGKRAGYAFAIPPEEMLNNEAFMAGYEIGYDAREDEYLEEVKENFKEDYPLATHGMWTLAHEICQYSSEEREKEGYECGLALCVPPDEMIDDEMFMCGYGYGYSEKTSEETK